MPRATRPIFQFPITEDAMHTPREIKKRGNIIKSEYKKRSMATIIGIEPMPKPILGDYIHN